MIIKCLLENPNCKGNCLKCGWNPAEEKRRLTLFINNGLTPCKDGLKRLVIKREDS